MNTTIITQTCSSVRKHTVPPPEGASLHGTRFNSEQISRAGRIDKRELHKPCGGGSSAPPIKADKVCSRQPEPIRTSDPRGYNTGNVPPSYGPEDGNLYDQETIEISTNKVI